MRFRQAARTERSLTLFLRRTDIDCKSQQILRESCFIYNTTRRLGIDVSIADRPDTSLDDNLDMTASHLARILCALQIALVLFAAFGHVSAEYEVCSRSRCG